MKTQAPCPTCHRPFSFWRIVFAWTPQYFYCLSCGYRIDLENAKRYSLVFAAVLVAIIFLLMKSLTPNRTGLFIFFVLLIGAMVTLDIILALVIVNTGRFTKPD
jgi:hypothetical protein